MNKKVSIHCPNCDKRLEVCYGNNQWVSWFDGECWTCGYRFLLKDTQFDLIQPDSPFFEIIYKYHPKVEAERKRKQKEEKEENRKAGLEEKYDTDKTLKPWVRKDIKKAVLEEMIF